MQTSPIMLRRAAGFTAATAIAYLLVRHFSAVHAGLARPLDGDEIESLHTGWLMHQGLRLYRDFQEDHAPFLYVILKWMVPSAGTAAFPRMDLVTYVARARIFSSTCGILGLAAAATVSYRAVRSLLAPLVAIAVAFASSWVWFRAIIQVRNDPPTLMLFWLGVLLLLGGWKSERIRFGFAGLGIGLIAIAAVWNPKWPLESIVMGFVYLAVVSQAFRRGPSMVALTVISPAVCVAASMACITATVPFRDYLFFTYRYNKLFCDWMITDPYLTKLTEMTFHGGKAFKFCAPAFKGVWPILAVLLTILLISLPAVRSRLGEIDIRIHWVLVALVAASLLEIRFIYPYPNVWTQYYVMWSFVLACLYGTTVAEVLRLLPREGMGLAATVAIALVAAVAVETALPVPGPTDWPMLSYLERSLRDGETVWIASNVHPIGVPDASYYWFASNDLVPFSIKYSVQHPGQTDLPAMTEADLPVCRAERGLQADLRFVSAHRFLASLPIARGCFNRLVASGRAVRTMAPDVWDLHPDPPRR